MSTNISYRTAIINVENGCRNVTIAVGDIWYRRAARAYDQQAVKIVRLRDGPNDEILVEAVWNGLERQVPLKSFNGKQYAPEPRADDRI